jgi:hypothetical protein
MFKKRKEDKSYDENQSLMIKFLHLQSEEFIKKFLQKKYPVGVYVDQTTAMTAGSLRVRIQSDNVQIENFDGYHVWTRMYIGEVKVWDNKIDEVTGYTGKSKLAKIVK